MSKTIEGYHKSLEASDAKICEALRSIIDETLIEAESKIWHAHPVWFWEENPIVGYGKLKDCVRLMFWSGQSFQAPGLKKTGSFKAAEIRYRSVNDIDKETLQIWLKESQNIQWDYKNIVKRKGRLERLK